MMRSAPLASASAITALRADRLPWMSLINAWIILLACCSLDPGAERTQGGDREAVPIRWNFGNCGRPGALRRSDRDYRLPAHHTLLNSPGAPCGRDYPGRI